jgi:predicted transcriptional regulator
MDASSEIGLRQIVVPVTSVAVLATADSKQKQSDLRGHLLEDFLGLLLGRLGYGAPTTDSLRTTSEGIEIDVTAEQKVTGQKLMAECKAYSAPIAAHHLNAFAGKYLLAREDDPQLAGIFLGLPNLTAAGKEQADALSSKVSVFKYLSSVDVCGLLKDANLLPSIDQGPSLKSDLTVLITEHGLALSAIELDPESRRAVQLVVWNRENLVPDPLKKAVEASPLAEGLPVAALGSPRMVVAPRSVAEDSIVVVRGSSSDFEYQLPAAPKFFVGRKGVSETLGGIVRDSLTPGTFVINAKSGWGKSSLALRLQHQVEGARGVAMIVDTRTATTSRFVPVALEQFIKELAKKGLVKVSEDAAFSSVASCLNSLRTSEWKANRPALLFFDQFENVFRDEAMTREFRDLAVQVPALDLPVTVGFAWKTDLVGWTEDHPYALRDEIRDASQVMLLDPLGQREIETLLRRLEKALGEKLDADLRRRLKEYSQGLPWLFKKLASHILSETKAGVTQDTLVRESLNIQNLFEADLAELSPQEQESLRLIAQRAPALVSELEDSIPAAVVQSLLNRRLIVQVGDRLDTYWDIFRDFLLTGQVAIEDSYIMRYGPPSVSRLMRLLVSSGGSMSVTDAASKLGTSANGVFNLARELRQMGLIRPESNRFTVQGEVFSSSTPEDRCRVLVAEALRRHKISTVLIERLSESDDPVTFAEVARLLPGAFPTVEVKEDSWITYARAFCQWLAYAGLVGITVGGQVCRSDAAGVELVGFSLFAPPKGLRLRGAFPQSPAGPAQELLLHFADTSNPAPGGRRYQRAVAELSSLGIVSADGNQVTLEVTEVVRDGRIDGERLRECVLKMPGCLEAFKLLESNPSATPGEIGALLKAAFGATWGTTTTSQIGKNLRSWARLCGLTTEQSRKGKPSPPSQASPQISIIDA